MAYEVEVKHTGLHKYRIVRGPTAWEARAKAEAQLRAWDEQWQRKVEADARRRERQDAQDHREARKAEAERTTQEATALREELEGILAHTLQVNDAIDWKEFRDERAFGEPSPPQPTPPPKPVRPELRLPERDSRKPGLFRRFLEGLDSIYEEERLERDEEEHEARVTEAKRAYNEEVARYNEAARLYNEGLRTAQEKWHRAFAAWRKRRDDFLAAQKAHNQKVAEFARRYQTADPEIVTEYCELVLQRSKYPDLFPGDFDVRFIPQDGTLIVEFGLPSPASIPSPKSARYIATRDTIEATDYKPAEKARIYEKVLCQTALRTIHELYEADTAVALRRIAFNGWTRSVDPATGKDISACIVSVLANREDFIRIDLSRVDPEKCIQNLGAVVSANLRELTPVAPFLGITGRPARSTEGREVLTGGSELRELPAQEGHRPSEQAAHQGSGTAANGPTAISCPNCGVPFRLSPALRGKDVKCGSCGRKFHVPW